MQLNEKEKLTAIASDLRHDIIEMIYRAKSGHTGGSMSAVEIMTLLYFKHMRIDPSSPQWEERDRFVASKGHCAPVLYAALAKRGFFDRELLWTLRQEGSILQGHPDMKKIPGVDMSTGSLGLGLSVSIGMALAAKRRGADFTTYVLLGDGEIEEGQVWEALMSAVKFKVDNVVAILDYNNVQLDGFVSDIMPQENLALRFTSFGWEVIEADGNDLESMDDALEKAKAIKGKPAIIIARTTKGKGVSFMENTHIWHGKPITDQEYALAMAELNEGGCSK